MSSSRRARQAFPVQRTRWVCANRPRNKHSKAGDIFATAHGATCSLAPTAPTVGQSVHSGKTDPSRTLLDSYLTLGRGARSYREQGASGGSHSPAKEWVCATDREPVITIRAVEETPANQTVSRKFPTIQLQTIRSKQSVSRDQITEGRAETGKSPSAQEDIRR